jgi:Ribbon-helix-helix protein, copG family
MRKTSVYLTDAEAEGLRRAARETGRSQADLIRDGVHHVLVAAGLEQRHFCSLGRGHGGGDPYSRWDANDVHAEVMGKEQAMLVRGRT